MVDNKIAIIGKVKGWELAPLDENSWGATQLILRRHVSRVVDMNDYSDDRWGEQETADAEKSRVFAREYGVPYIDLKSYPFEDIKAFFKTDYFTNTIDYMIALAIYEGYKEIDLYGINMSQKTEYEYQKSSVDYWCGQAMGRGIKVTVHGERSMIMKSPDNLIYGYYTPRTL